MENLSLEMISGKHLDTPVKRRQGIAVLIYDIWTQGGSDDSGLAAPILDGRLDALGRYTMLLDIDDCIHEPTNKKGISYREASCLSYDEFKNDFMFRNLPLIIRGVTDQWRARKWLYEENGSYVPDMQYLSSVFGADVAPVYIQSKAGFTQSRPVKDQMTFSDYSIWWNIHHNQEAEPGTPLLYLKDWKFMASNPELDVYQCPLYFRDDWLNEAMGNAYKFVYLGPQGTSTRLHADVLRSFSWSSNVCGRKRWFLIPPEYTYLLMDCFGRQVAPHLAADTELGLGLFFPG